MANRKKPTKKLDDLQAEIRSLNHLLLEMKDQSNALGQERNKYKEL